MQSPRFVPPFNLDRATFVYDSPTGKTFKVDAKYLDDRHYAPRHNNIRGLSTTTSSSSLALPLRTPPMSAPPRPSGNDLSSLHSSGKKNQNNTKRFWKIFSRKDKDTRSVDPAITSSTASADVPVKKHKSTPDLKNPRLKLVGNLNADPCYTPYRGFPPAMPSAFSSASLIRTSSERDITEHPTIIFVVDDNWDSLSADVPLQRVGQTIPVDITYEESLECSSYPDPDTRRTPQHHPIRGQRRRAETSKSSQGRQFNRYMHDPDASFLNMDVKK